jgi:hypothetical protein
VLTVGSTKDGLNSPFTNMTMEVDILNGVGEEEILRFNVAVVGVRSSFVAILLSVSI